MRRRNLERLIVEVVRGAVAEDGKRLLLVVEDVQWMNLHSMKLLLKASRRFRNIIARRWVMVYSRIDEADPRRQGIRPVSS